MLIQELEAKLLASLPASQAEVWDRTGMLVGNPTEAVRGVAVSLDPTRAALEFTVERGANVLLTHHPLFLDPPEDIKPAKGGGSVVGSRIWQAITSGVSVISFHTALDASPRAAQALANPLGLELVGELLQQSEPEVGYGRIAVCDASLGELAQRCESAFGRSNKIWGKPDALPARVCLWTGSASSVPAQCLESGIDALVCGELKYHEALDAVEAGLGIIELGHDVSEQVLCTVLVELLEEAGVDLGSIHLMDLPLTWR